MHNKELQNIIITQFKDITSPLYIKRIFVIVLWSQQEKNSAHICLAQGKARMKFIVYARYHF
jgi:hypothetical protein